MFRKFILHLNGFMWAGLFLPLSDDEIKSKVVSMEKYTAWREFLHAKRTSHLFQAEPPSGVHIDLLGRKINIQGSGKHLDDYKDYYEQSRLAHDRIPTTTIEPCDLEGAICWPIFPEADYQNMQHQEVTDDLADGEYLIQFTERSYCNRVHIPTVKIQGRWEYYAPRPGSRWSAAGTAIKYLMAKIGKHPDSEYLAGIIVYGDPM